MRYYVVIFCVFNLCLGLSPSVLFAQEQSIVKFKGVKTWELEKSPQDIGYKLVPNWLKIPEANAPKIVSGVAVDSKDNIFIVDRDSVPSVICVNSNGLFQFQWKPKGLGAPHFIHCDKNDDLWITDIKTHQIHKLSKKGEIILSIGVRGVNGNDDNHFDKPTDIAFPEDGSVLISDGYGQNKRIIKLDSKFNYIEEWGAKGMEPGKFAIPHALTIASDGKIYVADRDAWRIQIFNNDGKLLEVWPHIGRIFDIVEIPNNYFLCLDATTARVSKVDKAGNLIGFFGERNKVFDAHGMAITSKGDLLIALKDGRVEKFENSN